MKLKLIFPFIILVFLLAQTANCQQGIIPDTGSYNFINYNRNYIEYNNREILANFYKKWTADSASKIVIAHFGDSHIQPDVLTSTIRKKLQQLKGNAGRGMIFPYSIAKTYSQIDYASSYTGNWITGNSIQTPPRIAVGIAGFAAYTSDTNASFSIRFKTPLTKSQKSIKLFCNIEESPYSITVNSGTYCISKKMDSASIKDQHYLQFDFPSLSDTIYFKIKKDTSDTKTFKLYSISLEDDTPGVLYHNLGVGGANYSALKYQTYYEEQISQINPDLVILDWGTNDIIYKNKIDDKLNDVIVKAIERVRKSNPNTLIMLTSVQDMNYKKVNITAARKFSDMVRKIAFENSCLFYDWYKVSGGPKSMRTWFANNLSQKDNIHLNMRGYHLKGELFSQAFINTLNYYKTNDTTNLLLLEKPDTNTIDTLEEDAELTKKIIVKVVKQVQERHNKQTDNSTLTYKVKSSDCLSSIARKFNVSVSEIKKQNKLKSDNIRAGQKLIIRKQPKKNHHKR